MSVTRSPSFAASSAAKQPATPAPTTTTCSIAIAHFPALALRCAQFPHPRNEGRHDLLRITDHAEPRGPEDAGFRILVHGDDRLGAGQSRQMMHRAGDADGNVELRADLLAAESDLLCRGHPAKLDHCARGAHRRTERGGRLLNQTPIVLAAQAETA